MPIYKVKAGRVVTVSAETYVGDKGVIFYDEDTGELRLSDGETPGGISIVTGSTGSGTLIDLTSVSSHIIPSSDLTYDLGSTSSQWRSLYVGTSTIYLGGNAISVVGGNLTVNNNPITGAEQLIFTTEGNSRTLSGYRENGSVQTVRSFEIVNNKFRLTLATFTPTLSANGLPGNSLSWDQQAVGFSISINNPDDVLDQYITSIRSIQTLAGDISPLEDFVLGQKSATPAGGIDWTQQVTVGASSWIRPISSTIAGGSASARVNFNYYNGSSEVSYTSTSTSWTISWASPDMTMSIGSLSGRTFLETYTSVSYSVSVSGMSSSANYQHSVTAQGGSVSSAQASGTLTFTTPVHKNNTNQIRSVSNTTTFTRPSSVTGTQYSVQVTRSASLSSITFSYPSFYLFYSGVLPPGSNNVVSGSGFAAGVTQIGNQSRSFAGFINNSGLSPRTVWFFVRSSATQPNTFRTGASAALLSDVSAITGNAVELAPNPKPDGYIDEVYQTYGIVLQPGNTYVSVS